MHELTKISVGRSVDPYVQFRHTGGRDAAPGHARRTGHADLVHRHRVSLPGDVRVHAQAGAAAGPEHEGLSVMDEPGPHGRDPRTSVGARQGRTGQVRPHPQGRADAARVT